MKERRARGIGWFAGIGMVVAGTIGMGWGQIALKQDTPQGIGRLSVIVGVLLACTDVLLSATKKRSAAGDAQYQIGYDVGYDVRDQEIRKQAVLVSLDSRRCVCGKAKSLSAVANVADRG